MIRRMLIALSALLISISSLGQAAEASNTEYEAKDYSHLLGMPGFSDDALILHFKLYQGYVKTTNMIAEKLQHMAVSDQNNGPEYAGLKRMFGWEFDGMRLHEYYFSNLGGKKSLSSEHPLFQQMVKEFGSYEEWKQDFVATGMMRGIGWVVLYIEPREQRLMNTWIDEHDLGHLAGAEPLLVMDVFEHAYLPQFGLDRKSYIEAFFQNINWEEVSSRYEKAQIK